MSNFEGKKRRRVTSRQLLQAVARATSISTAHNIHYSTYHEGIRVQFEKRIIDTLPFHKSFGVSVVALTPSVLSSSSGGESQTIHELWNEAMSCAINHITLSGHTDCRKYVIPCTHDLPNVGIIEFVDHTCGGRFQLVLEDNEAKEIEVRLRILAPHFCHLCPVQRLDMLGCASDNSKAPVSVEVQQVIVIHRDYKGTNISTRKQSFE